MIALGTGFTALAFLGPNKLLEFAMQLLDLPTHGVLVLNVVRGETSLGTALRVLIILILLIQITIGDDL